MIGQEKLIEKLNSYTLQTLPRTVLLIGDTGSGRHTIINQLAINLNADVVELSEDVTSEDIIFYRQCPITTFYIIDLNKFNEKQQNQFLKFIEEPSASSYIFLIAKSEIGILSTILNRCIKFYLEQYSEEQLRQIANYDNSLVYRVCKTPGQLKNISEQSILYTYNLCYTMISKFSKANISNAISIETKINYKEEYSKIDFDIFFKMLKYVAFKEYILNNSIESFKIYKFTVEYTKNLLNTSLAKENFMINYLISLRDELCA